VRLLIRPVERFLSGTDGKTGRRDADRRGHDGAEVDGKAGEEIYPGNVLVVDRHRRHLVKGRIPAAGLARPAYVTVIVRIRSATT